MAADHASCRVAIYVKVTDIDGEALCRHITLGRAFCSSVLSRDFRSKIHSDGYDACHIPANFDSRQALSVYFLFDLGVKGPLPAGDALQIPRFVYLASRAQGTWNFIPRPRAIEKVKERMQNYPWGGSIEQEIFAELCT
ncbi:hypothetical protein BDV95DRAFT_583451 [Massariosphaeria phaeospora]|uniref:Uncharacterized protein n=1 Tax=Massariosphaeria phaeospora TaxID=100035 RepID=A0A7C8MH87_9PLEO|nr:hypothetical protein BDV95DRAFT_583451 [Massariosphaeria phaeospora]